MSLWGLETGFAIKERSFSILFAITAAVVVPCSGPQIPSTSSIRQIIF